MECIFYILELLVPKDVNEAGNSSNNESDSGPTHATASCQSSILLEPSPLNDIGTILDPTKSIETICLAVSNLLLLLLILAILIATVLF